MHAVHVPLKSHVGFKKNSVSPLSRPYAVLPLSSNLLLPVLRPSQTLPFKLQSELPKSAEIQQSSVTQSLGEA